jgi:hypothetical protein
MSPEPGEEPFAVAPPPGPRYSPEVVVSRIRGKLAEAGIFPDATLAAGLESAVTDVFEAMDDEDPLASSRRATRREAEAKLERRLRALLDSEQIRALDARLDGRTLVETLPRGRDDDTHSSTGLSEEKVATMVLETYRRRIGLPAEPHPGIRDAIARYIDAASLAVERIEAERGRGFVEAVCSGPTPHTADARLARDVEDYPVAALEARARFWRLQADFERSILPWLDEAQRKRLGEARPTGLRFLVQKR